MSSPGGLRTGLLLIVLCLCIAPGLGTASEPAPELEVFVRAGCPHCEAAKRFLQELQRARPELRILFHDLDLTGMRRRVWIASHRPRVFRWSECRRSL